MRWKDREPLSNRSRLFSPWARAGKARDALRADHSNLQLPRTAIRFSGGFSGCQWLCCSTFTQVPITQKVCRFLPKGLPRSCFVVSNPSKAPTQCQPEGSCFWMTHQGWVSDSFNNFAMRRIDPLCMKGQHGLADLLSHGFISLF